MNLWGKVDLVPCPYGGPRDCAGFDPLLLNVECRWFDSEAAALT